MNIKTRFAPSPTGDLHVGGARTALYSWLFARHMDGKFILRIEDTDINRSTKKAVKSILDSMKWLNLDWDEGPYFQTKRFDRYNSVINDMLFKGTAYKCYCSKERIEQLRKIQIQNKEKPRYDGYCRYKENLFIKNKACVVRFKNPQENSVIFHDIIRGSIKFKNKELDDIIIRRSDGFPTYNLCSVIDDIDMKITHIVRGEDHINNTPRQINIIKALDAPIPNYAHVSMILGSDGNKLSKRHGAVGIMQYRDNGFLPEALLNYLLRLGWSHGNQEIFYIDEMKKLFSLNTINKSPSIFNNEKLLWLNNHYIKHMPIEYIVKHINWHIKYQKIDTRIGPPLTEVVKIMNKSCNTLKEMASKSRFFYEDFDKINIEVVKKYFDNNTMKILILMRKKITILNEWTPKSIKTAIEQTANELQIDTSKIYMPLRIAVTGNDKSPAINITLYTIGQARSIARINFALNFIKSKI